MSRRAPMLLAALACLPPAWGMLNAVQHITTSQARAWHAFEMDSTRYLAVANYQDSVSSHNTDSKIYRWDGSSFTEFQTLATNGAWWWEAFTIDGTHYLAVANTHNDVTHDIDSKIYRFDGSSFIEFQSLATSGAREWEVFTIDGAHYLAVANGYTEDSWTHNTNSKIYRWDGSSFAEFQTLATNGACGWEAFTISGTQYLAVANNYNDKSYSIDSKIYRWDGSSFVEFQSLATNGAHGWEAFTLDGGHYLVVANSYNGASHSTDSKIYRWDGSVFAEFQALATHGALGWKAFAIDGTQYLAVANNYNDASYNIDSKIYRWDGSSFAEFQTWATNGAWCWEAFTIDDTQYLAVANYYSDSIIYTLTITTTTISTSFTTSTSTSSTSLTSTTTATRSSTSTSVTSTSTTTSSNSLTSTTTATRSSTSTSVTSSTSITSTTTRTEGPSALESSQFVFADAGAWCLGFLALYLLAIAVVLLMAHLWAKTGEPTQHPIGHPTPENDEPQESQEHQKFQEPHSQGQQTEEATPGKANQEREEMPISRMIRRSPYVLALNMVLESGNLVSSLLYVTEAYQRSALIGFSSACGSGVRVPLKAWNCPSETAALHLPACHNSLALGEWCEADSEVASPDCQVETDLDNCGKFDVYTMQMPPCADIGCPTLATGLWFFALLSLVLTIAWTAAFYTRTLLKRLVLQQQWRMRAFVFMTVLGILTIIIYMVGFVGGSSSVLAMAFLNPLLLLAAWSLALGVTFTPGVEKEAVVVKGAALEIPFFNALLAMHLKPREVEEIQDFRGPLNTGLRLVEDIPELLIGGLDLLYFGGAWYAWLGIACSMMMILFHLFVGIFLTCRQSAMWVAQIGRPLETE